MENLEDKIVDILIKAWVYGKYATLEPEEELAYAFLTFGLRKELLKLFKEEYGKVSEK